MPAALPPISLLLSIGNYALFGCQSLSTVFFQTTLTSIGGHAFNACIVLGNFNLLHTNLQVLNQQAFRDCLNLKSMTIPDSLQTFGEGVFWQCFKLIPSFIATDKTFKVVARLRGQQRIATELATEPSPSSPPRSPRRSNRLSSPSSPRSKIPSQKSPPYVTSVPSVTK